MKSYLNSWKSDFCAPVVVTAATLEVERLSIKNGLLFHELLSAFGRLDNINSFVRTPTHTLPITDAHIRFERISEVRPKQSGSVEGLIRQAFPDHDVSIVPGNINELRRTPPTAWTNRIDDYLIRSMSFSEYEMLSAPLLILTAVSTTDADPLACMQELSSHHHTPTSFSDGQYNPEIHRVYLIVHDPIEAKGIDPIIIQRKLQSKFPSHHTKLLIINSLPSTHQNLQQPDIWSNAKPPLFFPEDAPVITDAPINPVNGMVAFGTYLSIEDFMSLRNFCINLFQLEIVPCLDRRINTLTKIVKDNRKGVQNVIKSFWRKPREEVNNGIDSVRYRYDRIESQILLLADTSFIVKDYETALSMYRLVRDDFKSDKSFLHLAHCSIMIILCIFIIDPRSRDLREQLESFNQIIRAVLDVAYIPYFALLATELQANPIVNLPLEAAYLLLYAATKESNRKVTCGLLTEKAAILFLQAGYSRKYALHQILAGHKFNGSNVKNASSYANVCFIAASIVFENTKWGDIKAKLAHALVDLSNRADATHLHKSLLLLLHIIHVSSDGSIGGREESITAIRELLSNGPWKCESLKQSWTDASIYEMALHPNLLIDNDATSVNDIDEVLIHNLNVPELEVHSLHLVDPCVSLDQNASTTAAMQDMVNKFELEKSYMHDVSSSSSSGSGSGSDSAARALAYSFCECDEDFMNMLYPAGVAAGKCNAKAKQVAKIPLGENVVIRSSIYNKYPCDISLKRMKIGLNTNQFLLSESDIVLMPLQRKNIMLTASPTCLGYFKVESIDWYVGNSIHNSQSIVKQGSLLQNTLLQRVSRERGPVSSLTFEVVDAHPLLQISLKNMPQQCYDGQIISTKLVLTNSGAATACNIYIKQDPPYLVIDGAKPHNGIDICDDLLPPWGPSASIIKLSENLVLVPGQEIEIPAWLYVSSSAAGSGGSSANNSLNVKMIASYSGLRTNGAIDSFGPDRVCRSSLYSWNTAVQPALSITYKLVPKSSSVADCVLVMDITNNIPFKGGNRCDDDAIQLSSIWLMGALQMNKSSDISSNSSTVTIFPSQRLSVCLSASILFSDRSVSYIKYTLDQQQTCNFIGERLLQRFMAMTRAHQLFQKVLLQARREMQLKAEESENAGPRSIQQVREERVVTGTTSDLTTGGDTVATSSSSIICGEVGGSVCVSNCGDFKLPTCKDDLAVMAADLGTVITSIVWTCKRSTIHGICISQQVPVHVVHLSNEVRNTAAGPLPIFISISHPPTAVIDRETSRVVVIIVTLEIKSTSTTASFLLSAEAIDHRSILKSSSGNTEVMSKMVKKLPPSVTWESKTKHIDIIVPPGAALKLPFRCVVSKSGIYDMNVFNVFYRHAVDVSGVSAQHAYSISGQSLLEVM